MGLEQTPTSVELWRQPFVQRPKVFESLISHLLDSKRIGQIPIAALWGACGSGKTALAWEVCHDKRIREAFPQVPLWVTLGDNPGGITSRIQDLIETIESNGPSFSKSQEVDTTLRRLLEDRKSLIVIDDLWGDEHLRSFMKGVRNCAWLVTTRDYRTLSGNVPEDRIAEVEAMGLNEAVELLTVVREKKDKVGIPLVVDQLEKLAERLGKWPLFLKHATHDLADRTAAGLEAVTSLNKRLTKHGLTALDTKSAITVAFETSLKQVGEMESARCRELAVFPKEIDIPLATIEKFWAATGGLDGDGVEDVCIQLRQFSLIRKFERKSEQMLLVTRLCEGISQYLIWQQRDRLPELHNQLLDAHAFGPTWATMPDPEPYLWKQLAFHLIGAGRKNELVATVKDWRYLVTKIQKSMLPTIDNDNDQKSKMHSVMGDLFEAMNIEPADDLLRKLYRAFASINHLFDQHWMSNSDIKATLFARLQHLRDDLKPMLDDLGQNLESPYITFQSDFPSASDSALLDTSEDRWNESHQAFVISGNYNADCKWFVAASADHKLKIWDTQTGKVLRTLEGHLASVNGCAFNRDGSRIVSASSDRTLKVWDTDSGEMLHSFNDHLASVNGCAFSPDGSLIVSASSDNTLIIWDAHDGKRLHTLKRLAPWGELKDENGNPVLDDNGKPKEGEMDVIIDGHENAINDCAFSSDGKLVVSASDDGKLKIWDAESGALQGTLQDGGHSGFVKSCAFSDDNKLIVSTSADGTVIVWVWDPPQYRVLRKLERRERLDEISSQSQVVVNGHLGEVNDCALSSDGKLIVSASDDCTVKVWDVASGQCKATFYDDGRMNCCAIDGEIIVAGGNHGVYFLKLVRKIAQEP